jgi:transposase
MKVYVGLDVSLASISICVVDETGTIVREGKVSCEPDDVAAFLNERPSNIERIGLEAGPMSEWIAGALLDQNLPVVCLETRQVKAALSAMVVKTDRNDARGIAQVTRSGWFKSVHVKSIVSQRCRTLVTARKYLVRTLAGTEQAIRGLLRPFGLKVGSVTRRLFATRIKMLLDRHWQLRAIIEPLLEIHAALVGQVAALHKELLRLVRAEPICRRLMTMPGIGPVTALTYRSTLDDPLRFRHSRSVGAYLGLTPRRYQSGEIDRVGHISKAGDGETRTALFEAANVILRPATRWSPMKAWAVRVARRQGSKRAKVALARKMSTILHRMWVNETDFRWTSAA